MEHYISIYAYTYILYTHHPSSERNCATSAKKPPKTKDSPRQKKPSYLNHAPHLKELLTPHRLKERESANSACRDEALAKAGPKIVKKNAKKHKKYTVFTKKCALFTKKLQKIPIFPSQIDLRFVETRNLNTQPTRPLTSLRAHFCTLFNIFAPTFLRIIHHRQNHPAKHL